MQNVGKFNDLCRYHFWASKPKYKTGLLQSAEVEEDTIASTEVAMLPEILANDCEPLA